MATVPNFYRLETSRASLDFYNPMIDEPLQIRNGELVLPKRPGLGVELNRDYLKKHPSKGVGAWSNPALLFERKTAAKAKPAVRRSGRRASIASA
jgi:hypothetical protein